jgi:hypothetical protein
MTVVAPASTSSPPEEDEEDDWNLPLDFNLFAEHEPYKVYFPAAASNGEGTAHQNYFTIACVKELTPIDMISLSTGENDATGHCVWMGAFLLVACIDEIAAPYCFDRNIIELGCGTGIGGLALLTSKQRPKQVTFTDADPAVLQVCRRNCNLNLEAADHEILGLKWGEALPASITATYQTVLATDVLYDIGMLPPLFTTAALCLSSSATIDVQPYFVLAHVPRACYTSENPPVEDLELHIIERAKEFGFELERVIRTNSDKNEQLPADALNRTTLAEMHDVGAAILIFRMDGVDSTEG